MALPLNRMCVVRQYFSDTDGSPLADGYLKFFSVSSSTPKAVYSDSQGNISLGVQVALDSAGRLPSVFLANDGGYLVEVYTSAGVLVTTLSGDEVENVAEVFLAGLGAYQAQGARDVVSEYTVLADDQLVTINDTGTVIINLPVLADRTESITLKNVGSGTVDITPDAAESIEGLSAGTAYSLPAASSPDFPTVTLLPSAGDNSWWIQSSHALV